jgi:hypothetical protein
MAETKGTELLVLKFPIGRSPELFHPDPILTTWSLISIFILCSSILFGLPNGHITRAFTTKISVKVLCYIMFMQKNVRVY